MNKPTALFVFLLTSLPSLSASSQTSPSDAPAPPTESGAAPPAATEGSPPPEAAGAAADLPPPVPPALPPSDMATDVPSSPATPEERLGALEGKVDGVDESLGAIKATTDKLSKIKVSGYLQGRFESRGNSANGVTAAGKPATTNQFLVRRGRLKTVYEGTNAEYLLQIDATGSGVVLKDAEATFVDTWSPFGFRLTLGQFKWPFGYEILQSSGDREMPERSLVIRSLFPGERDRGFRVTGKYQWLRFAAALVNGTGTQDAVFPANDQNTFKDLVARVGGDFEWLVVGISGYLGRTLTPTSTAVPATYRRFSIARLGADAQFYYDVPGLGGLALKGEFVFSKAGNLDAGALDATTMMAIPQGCYDVTAIGYILTAVQNIGDNVGIVARFDSFDPNYSKALDATCPTAFLTKGQGDRVDTLGGGLLLYGSGNIKGTFTYEHIAEQSTTVKNDIFTAQLQARF